MHSAVTPASFCLLFLSAAVGLDRHGDLSLSWILLYVEGSEAKLIPEVTIVVVLFLRNVCSRNVDSHCVLQLWSTQSQSVLWNQLQ